MSHNSTLRAHQRLPLLYQRFVFRGLLMSMYSDNGIMFHGFAFANCPMHMRNAICNPNFWNRLATDGTAWHFLLSASSHFGDLWETGVKSVKHHLKWSIGLHILIFEEISTLLCWIEACLNSCPITLIFDNLDDYHTLTLDHFLVGTSLITPVEPSVLDLNEHRLSQMIGKWFNK